MQMPAAWGDWLFTAGALGLFSLWLGWKYRTRRHDSFTAVGAGVLAVAVLGLVDYFIGWKASLSALIMAALVVALVASSWLEQR